MILISHRGNLHGPLSAFENQPSYISDARAAGFEVEIDVWKVGNKVYLGHDSPQYSVEIDFLKMSGLWCHAKNLDALQLLLAAQVTCFWHQTDDYVVTSNGYIWAYPGRPVIAKCIAMMFDAADPPKGCSGVCSDYIAELRLC